MQKGKLQAGLLLACLLAGLLAGLLVRQRLGRGWTFVGADSFAYVGAARELYEHHRFAIPMPDWYPPQERQKPVSPSYGRMPGYPALLAVATQPAALPYGTIFERAKQAQWLLDIGTCLLVFLMARRLSGTAGGFFALAFAALSPFLCLFANAVLAETLATFLYTLTLWLWLEALFSPPAQKRVRLALGGVTTALAVLVRIDALLLLLCLLIPWFFAKERQQARGGILLALSLFLAVYGAWLGRNFVRFGQLHVLGGQCDVRGKEMTHTAFFAWFATWLVDEVETPSTLYCLLRPECISNTAAYPKTAFDSLEERREVDRIFLLRARQGLSEATDAGFRDLTWRRLRDHPLRTLLVLPLRRAYHQWISRNDQPLRATTPVLPWPRVTRLFLPHLRTLSALYVGLALLGVFALLRCRAAPCRLAAALLGLAITSRSAALALIGFVDARYLLEVHPAILVLASVAVASVPGVVRRKKIDPCQS
jgi:4-amino-4-deoxy-L-arabinose transferase-like glycosyltransferase